MEWLLILATALQDGPPPFAERYCFSCHDSEKKKAGLDLTIFADEKSILAGRKVWKDVWRKTYTREMPPAKFTQPTDEERARFTTWIENALGRLDSKGTMDPGRVVIRRLNRTEYKNTIRDLIGVDVSVDDFPSDDVGYGFDNIGDVLSLPPLLLEKYLKTADYVLERAIVSDVGREPKSQKIEAEHFRAPKESVVQGPYRILGAGQEMSQDVDLKREGKFILRISAGGDAPGGEAMRMAVKINGKVEKEIEVKASRARPKPVEVEIPLKAGRQGIAIAWIITNKKVQKSDKVLVVDSIEIVGPTDAPPPQIPETHRRIFIAEPGPKKPKKDAAKDIIAAFVSRAFRRPALPDEVNRFLRVFELRDKEGDLFEEAVKVSLTAVLVSPYFLFRIELDRPGDDPRGARPVNEFELASRLSYFIWSSMPDAELFDLARQGKLRDSLDVQVRRMLKDPKASELSESFSTQWLQIRRLEAARPDPAKFPSFDEPLRDAMMKEAVHFFAGVLNDELSALTLIDSDFTYVNERLARHYGLTGVSGSEFRKVKLSDKRRGGVLTMASVLTCTSNAQRTSPVKRGKWVLEALLGTPPPPPDPDVGDLKETDEGGKKLSLREAMELHRKKPACISCHQRMDPIGFGFENYDAVGAWREKDESGPLDTKATLPDGREFNGAVEFKQILMERKDEFVRNLIEKMLTYALGRGVEFFDAPTVRAIQAEMAKNDYTLSTLVAEIAKSYPFLHRRNRAADPEKGEKQ